MEVYNVDNIWQVVWIQFINNIKGFFTLADFSNQYGNGPLLDTFSSILFFTGIVIFLISVSYQILIKKTIRKIDLILSLILLFFLLINLSVATTESSPLSTRLLISLPMAIMFIAYPLFLLYKWIQMKTTSQLIIISIVFIILGINLTLYFGTYRTENKVFYNWIEPMATVGDIYNANENANIALLRTPSTYLEHPIIKLKNDAEVIDAIEFDINNIPGNLPNRLIVTYDSFTEISPEDLGYRLVDSYYGYRCKECDLELLVQLYEQ